jgi:hypothetical protein
MKSKSKDNTRSAVTYGWCARFVVARNSENTASVESVLRLDLGSLAPTPESIRPPLSLAAILLDLCLFTLLPCVVGCWADIASP